MTVADPTYRHLPVAVHAETVMVDEGLHCAACRQNTAIRVWVAMSLGERMHLQERLHCRRCGSGAHVVNDRT